MTNTEWFKKMGLAALVFGSLCAAQQARAISVKINRCISPKGKVVFTDNASEIIADGEMQCKALAYSSLAKIESDSTLRAREALRSAEKIVKMQNQNAVTLKRMETRAANIAAKAKIESDNTLRARKPLHREGKFIRMQNKNSITLNIQKDIEKEQNPE